MQIWKGTRLSTLLLVHPASLEVLLGLGSEMGWLRDPEARRLQAHRLSLSDVAHRVGRPVEEIVDLLKEHLT